MRFIVGILFTILSMNLFSENKSVVIILDSTNQNSVKIYLDIQDQKPNPVFQLFHKKHKLNKRITAAVLAFPFPFGIVGLHRIYLGTKPYVPVAYIASLGGGFGVLPLIDFFAITFDKNFDHYRDNGKVFMWVKE
jgi:hypothetical protein